LKATANSIAASLDGQALRRVAGQLSRERKARRDCEDNAVRLFLSSLTAGDLELAAREIANEQAARNQECLLAVRPTSTKSR